MIAVQIVLNMRVDKSYGTYLFLLSRTVFSLSTRSYLNIPMYRSLERHNTQLSY